MLNSIGVNPSKVYITGDDAIELAYKAHKNELGSGIGVSIRVMPYTGVDDSHLQVIGDVLNNAARKYRAKLIGLPISMSIHERDDRYIWQLLRGRNNYKMNRSSFQSPLEVINNTHQCRLVVTGTYHAALFALAQGIPAICIANSESYFRKFYGLADLFDNGCEVIGLQEERFDDKLSSLIDFVWQSAENNRLLLLDSAAQQIKWGHAAYQQLHLLVGQSTPQ